jgi:hypothetical protein
MNEFGGRDGDIIFPLPSWQFPPRRALSSRRGQQRASLLIRVTITANNAVAALNILNRSMASEAASFVQPPLPCISYYSQQRQANISGLVSAAQRRALELILQRSWLLHSRDFCDGNRSEHPFSDLSQSQNSHQSSFDYVKSSSAPRVPLVASKLSLPRLPGSAHLLELLPVRLRDLYADPTNLLLPQRPAEAPSGGSVFTDSGEYRAVIERLRALDMIDFTVAPKAVNGLFAVDKGDGTQRLILDARPANSLFVAPAKVKLPTPDLIGRLHAISEKPVFAAKVDLDSFFHRFVMPMAYRPYFAMPSVRAGDIGLGNRFGYNALVYPCMTRLPMGWSHSVLLAQSAHEFLLDTATSLSSADRITAENDALLDRIRHAIYVDDLVLLSTDRQALLTVQRQYIAVVEARGLPVKQSKVVLPTSDGVELLGLQFLGRDFLYGLRAGKLLDLIDRTQRVIATGFVSGIELASLVGHWTWAVLARRPVLAVFQSIYRYIAVAKHRLFTLWESVKLELRMVCALAPFLVADLRPPFFRRVLATDSSSFALGVCSSRVPQPRQRETALAAGLGDSATVTDHQRTAVANLARSTWMTVTSARWKRPLAHINEGELRALHTAVKWTISQPAGQHKRLLVFCDSTAVVGCVSKGRSSSTTLLRRLRPLTALVLAFALQLAIVWVPSACNPADAPSRLFIPSAWRPPPW